MPLRNLPSLHEEEFSKAVIEEEARKHLRRKLEGKSRNRSMFFSFKPKT